MAALITRGTPAYRRLTLAMLFAGFSTFTLLYSVQALLPLFAQDFRLDAETASLAVSIATGPLAIGILFAGGLSDRIGRRPMMIGAMFLAGAFSLAGAQLPSWPLFLACRFVMGLALAGVPAVAMAYVSEEVDHGSVGGAMGLYIAGSAIGGMSGRLGISLLTSLWGWRAALTIVAVASLAMAEAFRRLAPPPAGFQPFRANRGDTFQALRNLLADRALPLLYAEAFLLMGVFVTIYNYAGFRLMGPPYNLGHAAVGAIFLLYLAGSVSSTWFGNLAGRRGRRLVFWVPVTIFILGIGLTALRPLPLVILGIGVVTIGFFGAHSIASAWVGRRAQANRGLATALYLFFYYLGSSVLGSIGGIGWTRAGWPGVAGFCAVLMLVALGLAIALRRVPPLPQPEETPIRPLGTD